MQIQLIKHPEGTDHISHQEVNHSRNSVPETGARFGFVFKRQVIQILVNCFAFRLVFENDSLVTEQVVQEGQAVEDKFYQVRSVSVLGHEGKYLIYTRSQFEIARQY